MDVDSGSCSLTGAWCGPLEPGTLLWPWPWWRLGHTELTGSTGGVLSEHEQNFAVNLRQAGFDRAGTTKPPHEAC